jgi:hypothetical protein
MDCPRAEQCFHRHKCGHKDMAEYCAIIRCKEPDDLLLAFEENRDIASVQYNPQG